MKLVTLEKAKLKKVMKGAGIAGGAAALTYILEALPGLDLGELTPIVMAIISVKINYLRKLKEQHGL